MTRELDTATLSDAARRYAAAWMQPDRRSVSKKRFISGPRFVLEDLYNVSYKDEFEFIINSDQGIKAWLGGPALADFEKRAKEHFKPREDKVFAALLKEKLAIDPNGKHIEGVIGKVQVGTRPIARRMFEIETRASIRRRKELGLPVHVKGRTDRETIRVPRLLTWPVYAGEREERDASSSRPDELPEDAMPTLSDGRHAAGVGAVNPNISAEAAIGMCNFLVDSLDEGSTAASIRGRTGAQPADPDATEDGTLLFTLVMDDPAFGAAADDSPGALATAGAIADDVSADATNTLGYCRAGATGTGADDHIDGSVGTADANFIFNSLSIVAGALISMSAFTVFQPQGATAV
jgi:hypothetical protein